MSFAICRMQKMKKTDLKGMQFHNQRERESRINFDIDPTRTKENVDLVNAEKINYNERVKEIIESQKTTDRKIRKDAVMVNELIVTSDRAFFEQLPPEEEIRFFEESKALFAKRYGEQNLAYAMIHRDEKTPHMHLGVVPMKDGKLQGKHVFDRKELRWMQEEFPKHMKAQGFELERGEPGSDRKHLSAQRYKLQTLKEEIQTLESDVKAIEAIDQDLKAITLENKEKRSMGFVGPEKVEMPKENYEKLYAMAHRSYEHATKREDREDQIQRERGKNKTLEEENQKLREENRRMEALFDLMRRQRDLWQRTAEACKAYFQEKGWDAGKIMGMMKATASWRLKPKPEVKRDFYEKDELAGRDLYQSQMKEKQKVKNRNQGIGM